MVPSLGLVSIDYTPILQHRHRDRCRQSVSIAAPDKSAYILSVVAVRNKRDAHGQTPSPAAALGEQKVLQVAAVLAVGAAAMAFVGGVGMYLSIRFTQHRSKPPGEEKSPRGSKPAA